MHTFTVDSIGKIVSTPKKSVIQLESKYSRALKNCDLFSHLLIFWWHPQSGHTQINERSPSKDETRFIGAFASREIARPNPIQLTTIRLKAVNIQQGVIEFVPAEIPNHAQVIDIKAHIPVSDRVKDVVVSYAFGNLPKFIPELPFDNRLARPKTKVDPNSLPQEFILEPIGTTQNRNGRTVIIVAKPFVRAMAGLDNFSHIRITWWFHRFDRPRYRRIMQVTPPYERAPKCGVFATRSPVRPNPIGLTTAQIDQIDYDNGCLHISGFDAFDKTPILDIKPYIPHYDRVKSFAVPDWFKHWPEYATTDELSETADPNRLYPSDPERLAAYGSRSLPSGKPSKEKLALKSRSRKQIQPEKSGDCIQIIGARQNNLKNIDVHIPHNSFTVITGVSGSGKSSLAFDTLYAEGQYRYLKSLSTTARQIAQKLEQPDVDHLYGLHPTIAIGQRLHNRNSRSTVGSHSDIYSLLRVLFAKIGQRHCPGCGRAVVPCSAQHITNMLVRLPQGACFTILPGNGNSVASNADLTFDHPGQQAAKETILDLELSTAVQTAFDQGNGYLNLALDNGEEYRFCERNGCPYCQSFFFEMTPQLFNPNNPDGMCPDCEGLGLKHVVDPQKVVAAPELSLLDGASPWFGILRNVKPSGNWMRAELFALTDLNQVDLEKPWQDQPETFRHQVLYGSGDQILTWQFDAKTRGRSIGFERSAQGAVNNIKRLISQTSSSQNLKRLLEFTSPESCSSCNGEKLSGEARLIQVNDKRYPEVSALTIAGINSWVAELELVLEGQQFEIAVGILHEIKQKTQALMDIGLHYLSLDRAMPTLSGGEAQRVRLASYLNNELSGLIYVLDEPSIGLHPKDNQNLLLTLIGIKQKGNTVVVVEHDAETMLHSDWLIDIGPGAGTHGGEVVACGSPDQVMDTPASLTGQYLSGESKISVTTAGQTPAKKWIKLTGCEKNNLKNVDARFPVGCLTCVTGVSGSGKSSLVVETLSPALTNALNQTSLRSQYCKSIDGVQYVDKLVVVDQSPIGRTPRSNPATYTQLFDEIRKIYAQTPTAKARDYTASNFSFNSPGGRCEACKGHGKNRIELNFMPDIWVTCMQCHGLRYNPQTLDIKFQSLTIADVLYMDVAEAADFFKQEKKITKILDTLIEVGLEYIKLGQSALSFSGGEAQRIKLAKEFCHNNTGKTVYILDEPTTGLHFADIQNLLNILGRLTQAGNTVIVIEHDLNIIQAADWVIDLGPEGGHDGGQIIATGRPADIMNTANSHTGKYLCEHVAADA